jgi:hypothetical protein
MLQNISKEILILVQTLGIILTSVVMHFIYDIGQSPFSTNGESSFHKTTQQLQPVKYIKKVGPKLHYTNSLFFTTNIVAGMLNIQCQ